MTQIQKNNEPKQTLLTYIWSFKVAKRVQVGGCWLESTPHHPPFLATFVGIQLSVSMLWLWAALKSNRLHLYFILFTLLHMIFFSCNFLLVWEVGVLRREKDWPIFTWQVKSWTQNITSSILQVFLLVISKLHVLPTIFVYYLCMSQLHSRAFLPPTLFDHVLHLLIDKTLFCSIMFSVAKVTLHSQKSVC